MGINIKRIILLSFLNYFIRKSLKRLDYNLLETDHITSNLLYSCFNCESIFSDIFLIKNTKICPICNSSLTTFNDSFNI